MSFRQLLKDTAARFREADIPDPEVDAALLLARVTGRDALSLRLDTDHDPTPEQQAAFEALCERRLTRMPLQYLLGDQSFLGRSFQVDSRVLIPRPETELLAERAIHALHASTSASPHALDLCCGSGCLAVSMALEVPAARVDAADLSQDALLVTENNARLLGANLRLLRGDLWAALPPNERYDLIVSNPPYIPAADCDALQPEVMREPRMALDGGQDGLDFYRRIAHSALSHLTPGGVLLLEVGFDQAEAVCTLLVDAGFSAVQSYPDLQGIQRMVEAHRPYRPA